MIHSSLLMRFMSKELRETSWNSSCAAAAASLGCCPVSARCVHDTCMLAAAWWWALVLSGVLLQMCCPNGWKAWVLEASPEADRWRVVCVVCGWLAQASPQTDNWRVVCAVCGWLAQGQVYALAFANNTLFTAGQDTSIRVWNLNEQAGIFVSQVGVGGCGCGCVLCQSHTLCCQLLLLPYPVCLHTVL